MTNDEFQTLREYQYAPVAVQFAQQKNMKGAQGSLEKLVGDLGIGEKAKPFIEGAFQSQEGIVRAINLCAEQYQKAMNPLTMDKVYSFLAGEVPSYVEGKTGEGLKALFDKFKDMTAGDLVKKVARANAILENEQAFKKDEVEDAKKTAEKYEDIFSAYKRLEGEKTKKLYAGVDSSAVKKDLAEIAKKYLPKE